RSRVRGSTPEPLTPQQRRHDGPESSNHSPQRQTRRQPAPQRAVVSEPRPGREDHREVDDDAVRERETDRREHDRRWFSKRLEQREAETAAERLFEDRDEYRDREKVRDPGAESRGIEELGDALLPMCVLEESDLGVRERV